jgi:hypothetical protein
MRSSSMPLPGFTGYARPDAGKDVRQLSVDPQELAKLVNRSGFLFQIAVEEHVRHNTDNHGWEVMAREYPWSTVDRARSGFIDFVAGRGTLRCVFECKRTQGGEWIFLVRDSDAETSLLRTLWSFIAKDDKQGWGWDDLHFEPATLRSEFCFVRGASDDDKPMLERIATDLVKASESLAREELGLRRRFRGPTGYLPVIVTNANLYACRVDPKEIDLASGNAPSSAKFEPVLSIRFRKSLGSDVVHAPDTYESVSEGSTKKERSAFVVHVSHLTEWLSKIKEKPLHFYPWSHL